MVLPSLGRKAAVVAGFCLPVGGALAYTVSSFLGVPIVLAGIAAGAVTLAAVHAEARSRYGRLGAVGFYLTMVGVAFVFVPFMQLLSVLALVGFPMFLFGVTGRSAAAKARIVGPVVVGAASAWVVSLVLEHYAQPSEPALTLALAGLGATLYELGRTLEKVPPVVTADAARRDRAAAV